MIANPLYKGKWIAPKIPNPLFKGNKSQEIDSIFMCWLSSWFVLGIWMPRLIANPEYFQDSNPVNSLAPIIGLAVEVWTTNAGIHFDNFVVSNSEKSVESFTGSTYRFKAEAEAKKHKDEKRIKREQEFKDKLENGTFSEKVRVVTIFVADYLAQNPMALVASVLAIVLPFLYLILFGGRIKKSDPVKQRKAESEPSNTDNKEQQDQ